MAGTRMATNLGSRLAKSPFVFPLVNPVRPKAARVNAMALFDKIP